MLTIVLRIADALEGLLAVLLTPRHAPAPATYTCESRSQAAAGRRQAGSLALQLAVLAAAAVPVAAGAWGVISALGASRSGLASHERYLSGLLLAIGLAFWSTLPAIERKTERFRLLAALVVVGGLCRLAGVTTGDALTAPTAAALVMELAVTPLLCLWQSRRSRA